MNAEKDQALQDRETEEELRDSPKQLPVPTPNSPHYAFNLPHHHHKTSPLKEEHGLKPHTHPEWSHPERLSDMERENLVSQVPKDTIELLKEGHSEYFIK